VATLNWLDITLTNPDCYAKPAFNKNRAHFTSKMDLELRKKLGKCYIWSIALYGTETLTLWAVDQKHLENFEMWC
jgi:hypothetical protein